MPDIRDFSMSARTDGNVNVARITVAGKVVADDGVTVLGDFTGANTFDFAFRVQGLSVAQHRRIADDIAFLLLRLKAGLEG